MRELVTVEELSLPSFALRQPSAFLPNSPIRMLSAEREQGG